MDRSSTSRLDRRSFLKAASGLGKAAAVARVLSPGLSMLAAPVRSRAEASTPEPLMQPAELHSANGVLDATITAAPGPVRLGEHAFPGAALQRRLCAPDAAGAPRRHAPDHVPQQSA